MNDAKQELLLNLEKKGNYIYYEITVEDSIEMYLIKTKRIKEMANWVKTHLPGRKINVRVDSKPISFSEESYELWSVL